MNAESALYLEPFFRFLATTLRPILSEPTAMRESTSRVPSEPNSPKSKRSPVCDAIRKCSVRCASCANKILLFAPHTHRLFSRLAARAHAAGPPWPVLPRWASHSSRRFPICRLLSLQTFTQQHDRLPRYFRTNAANGLPALRATGRHIGDLSHLLADCSPLSRR
jgi:hypothetical protein